jgi:CRISPR-associated endonuclease Cas1
MAATRTTSTHPAFDLSAWDDVSTDPRVIVVDGSNIQLTIRRNCLVIKDGPHGTPRERTIEKIPARGVPAPTRLVILSLHGMIAGEVFLWLHQAGIQWSMYDRDDKHPVCIGTSGGYADSDLVRAQAQLATGGQLAETGVAVVRRFLRRKLRGQARNADELLQRADVAAYITRLAERIETATDEPGKTCLEVMRGYEGDAAAQYWQAWRDMPLRWKGNRPTSKFWLAYPGRASLRFNWETNSRATDPVNAMLNWGYKILESEAVHLLHGAAMDASLGILHADMRKRESLALDLMETGRWVVDEIVWRIAQEPMQLAWFRHLSDGTVLCNAPLTHRIANLVRAAAQEMMPDVFYAERQIRAAGDAQRAQLRQDAEAGRTDARVLARAAGRAAGRKVAVA